METINITYENWLKNVTGDEKAELLSIKDNANEIKERFSKPLEFGTAGMRGIIGIGTYRMNVYTVRRAAAGLAEYICTLGNEGKKMGVVIAYDTRRFSRTFAFAAAEVIAAYDIKVFIFEDVRPVPVCSFAIRKLQAFAGIMITASHNPKEYNGFKVYGNDGAQMAPEATKEVVKFIENLDYFNIKRVKTEDLIFDTDNVKGKDNLRLHNYITVFGKSIDAQYYDTIEKLALSSNLTKSLGSTVRLVYTPIHGTGYLPVTTMFNRLGIKADIVDEQTSPDPEFSTVDVPNPENANALRMGIELGYQNNADVILATDPDCDRLGVAIRNDKNEFVLLSGNQIGVLLLDYICQRLAETQKLPANAAVVKSIVSTTMADKIASSYKVKTVNVLTGFKYIGEKIKEWELSDEYTYIFGFEESYGTLRGTHARDKDAVVGSMLFAEMLIYYAANSKTVFTRLKELFEEFGYYTEKNISVTYKGVSAMDDMALVMKKLRGENIKHFGKNKVLNTRDFLNETPSSDMLYYELSDNQFVCIRPSGTEPKLKAYILTCDNTSESSVANADSILEDIKKLI